ncbi:hypothetical protein EVAR_11906_1 [Eumeta japonica]|uniref:Uncharacterized protein n=1 Tax=Eumeta variegata TaxID=151549 RepID=A0A4C1U8F7_EUMVA|nr:hypothetical protein EVAR_11906_1 [Eumeta japonica]
MHTHSNVNTCATSTNGQAVQLTASGTCVNAFVKANRNRRTVTRDVYSRLACEEGRPNVRTYPTHTHRIPSRPVTSSLVTPLRICTYSIDHVNYAAHISAV